MQSNLEWFRTFKAIYETGTMSGAAKQLYITQPGVSLHLNALEGYTGFPLFERTARKMIPTEKGHQLYQQVIQSLVGLEDIETRFKKKAGKERATVSVGMCVETFQHALEKHIPDLNFNLIMQFESNPQLTLALERGALDLILTSEVSTNKALTFSAFTVEKLVLIAGNKVNLEAIPDFDSLTKSELKAWLKEQIWYNTASDMRLLNTFWEKNFNETPDFFPNYIVPNKYSILRCLSRGDGFAVLSEFLCGDALREQKVFKVWEGYKPIENTLYFGKRKQSLYMDEIKTLEEMLMNEFLEKEEIVN
ncbi:LysR family transcriptional regulator [Chondrinema litorale]|uniref:LysR family transcriptional regulator n=1 Tax=Chondrinema litorale TaxID=2994555 RepID=UPI002542F13F|nr:LysR family transcriptional regulator [Chondrinema litorale]UZR96439.1 LysR family transcriptional regulator [Chondrinema litorale]